MSSSTTERSHLLENGNGAHDEHHISTFHAKALRLLKGEGEPSFIASYRSFWFGSIINLLLLFVPLSIVAHQLNWDAALRFVFSFISIIPLAALIGEATDQMSVKLGQTMSGLLNASFGNAVEIIVGIAALLQGQLRIVQTSMLGSILSNLLLVLGSAFFAAGLKYDHSSFGVTAAQASSSLMTLACITLVLPAAYHSFKVKEVVSNSTLNAIQTWGVPPNSDLVPASQSGLLIISRGTAILLLLVYVGYLIFQLKTHSELFNENDVEPEEPYMSTVAAGSALLIVTVITAFCADYLVASIEETAQRYHVPKPFIGLILLPIVSNAAEHVTAIWMALKNKMELSIGICVGSSIQIAVFVVPFLVIIGWISGHELTLFFENFETIVFFVSVMLVNLLIQDGKSNYMEGLMLLTLYLVIALTFWVS